MCECIFQNALLQKCSGILQQFEGQANCIRGQKTPLTATMIHKWQGFKQFQIKCLSVRKQPLGSDLTILHLVWFPCQYFLCVKYIKSVYIQSEIRDRGACIDIRWGNKKKALEHLLSPTLMGPTFLSHFLCLPRPLFLFLVTAMTQKRSSSSAISRIFPNV